MAEAADDGAPRPRTVDGLDVNEVDDGLVVYDGDRDRVHYLDHTAGAVFALCDGTHAEAALGGLVRDVFGGDEPGDDAVAGCLGTLRAEGLVR